MSSWSTSVAPDWQIVTALSPFGRAQAVIHRLIQLAQLGLVSITRPQG